MDRELSVLRDREAGVAAFRAASRAVCNDLVARTKDILVDRAVPLKDVVSVLILRSGVVFLSALTEVFPAAPVGVIGLRRDEETLEPKQYYENLPVINDQSVVLICDPMLATGGTVAALVEKLVTEGADPKKIYFTGIIGAKTGLDKLITLIPEENILLAALDEKLDKDGMIVPGLGDFGDRYFAHEDRSLLA